MSLSDQLMLGVPAIFGGIPILIKLASTLVILFLVAGFYLGVNGTLGDNDLEQALAALSGLFALGAFLLRQWGNFHRQSLIHQKQLTDNIYYRNINNNSGIFSYLIGEAEEQEWKEALLAYYCLLTAAEPLTRESLEARIEELLSQRFGVAADFAIGEALTRLKGLGLLGESGGIFRLRRFPQRSNGSRKSGRSCCGLAQARVDLVERRGAGAKLPGFQRIERRLHGVEMAVQVVRIPDRRTAAR